MHPLSRYLWAYRLFFVLSLTAAYSSLTLAQALDPVLQAKALLESKQADAAFALLAPLERAGGHLWRRISPFTRGLLPLRSPGHAALFGMLWGWIPCGMVYAMLLTAMSSGSAVNGMATMLAFGAGTLPAMLLSGWAAGTLQRWTRQPRVRVVAGLVIVILGAIGLARAGSLEQLQAFGAFCTTWMQSTAGTVP